MRYYALYNPDNTLLTIGTGFGGIEITEEEYNTLLTEIKEKKSLVKKVYNEEITIDEVPVKWKEEIQTVIEELIFEEQNRENLPISSGEFYSMIEEVL